MDTLNGFEEVPGRVLASLVTSWEMPEDEVTPRTQATRSVGALFMLAHLVEGDWNTNAHEVMEEFVRRLVTNAARQGIAPDTTIAEHRV